MEQTSMRETWEQKEILNKDLRSKVNMSDGNKDNYVEMKADMVPQIWF